MMQVADRRAHIDLLEAYRLNHDRASRDRLVEELMPLVRSLARRYAGRGEPIEDLVQVGAIGLIKAIDRFDLERGVELSTYAVPTIVGRDPPSFSGSLLERSRSPADEGAVAAGSRASSTISPRSSAGRRRWPRSPRPPTLRRKTWSRHSRLREPIRRPRCRHPVDASGELTLIDLIGENEDGYEALERGSVVRTGLEGLEERERRIIVLRFLNGMTQSEIAADLGMSQMHVSRLLRRALAAMHGRLDDGEGRPV